MSLRIPITSRDQWLARRKFDVTASVVGALPFFGVHPYVSPLRLYYQKQGLLDLIEQEDSGPLRRGRILEPAVAAAVIEQRPEWRLEKNEFYYCDDAAGIGATPDYHICDLRGRAGLLQAKTAIREWQADESGELKPPRWIELQLQTELMLTEIEWGAIACLVVNYEMPCAIIEMTRDPAIEQQIRNAVASFWQDIETGREPHADHVKDREFLSQLLPREESGQTVDLRGDNEIIDSLVERRKLKEEISAKEDQCKKIEARLMQRMGAAEFAVAGEFRATWRAEHRKGFTVEPSDPRVLRIRNRKEIA